MSQLLKTIDQLIIDARLQDLRLIACMPSDERATNLAAVLSQLNTGYYLLGCGPYNSGLIKLGENEIVLGRQSSPLEEMSESVVDYMINDAVLLTPREVSRNHATIRIDEEEGVISLYDNGSTSGTWLNGQRLDSSGVAVKVEPGSVITLGQSGVNAYLCFEVGESDGQ
jgi:pSer/pThr/pTyr-binding forkhead associated (FHA) protein